MPARKDAIDAHRTLWLAVLVALALRMVVVGFLYRDQLKPANDHWAFGYETGRIARSIVTGKGFSDPLFAGTGPTGMMPPIHTYMVAGVFKVFGIYSSASAIILLSLNVLFSALTCIPVFFIARKCFGPSTAKVSIWVWALFPYAILISATMIWNSCMATFLLAVMFWWTLRLEVSSSVAEWTGFGLFAGFTVVTSPPVATVFPFLVAYACYRRFRRGQRWFWRAAMACLAVVVVMTPWQVRNYRVFGRFVPMRNNFWSEVWIANNGDESFWTNRAAYPSSSEVEGEQYRRLGETKYMEVKRRQAIEFISGHPGWVARQTQRRFAYTWTEFWGTPDHPIHEPFDPEEPFDPALVAFCTGLTVLMIIGLRRAFREGLDTRWLFVAALVTIPFVYYFTRPHIRYRHPVDPQIVMLAVYAFTARKDAVKGELVGERGGAKPKARADRVAPSRANQ
ncbi:MAG: glycosyltransferase family 39 protein [Acidobacteriia bacterium]|nr:glycosyltransferase family 39 protein [Terriglobia bacterium]